MNKVLLGPASRLVFPRTGNPDGPLVYEKTPAGFWNRNGLLIPDSAHLVRAVLNEGWVNGEEQDILELWAAGTALPNTPSHVGLFTTTPADDGTGGTEVTGGSYAREAYARNGTNWGSSTAGAPSTIQSLVAITFTTASANWGTVASWGYFTAVTAGTLLLFAVLDTSKAVNNGDTAELAAGAAVIQLGDPGDTY